MRLDAISIYSFDISIPINFLLFKIAILPVVPLPRKQSKTASCWLGKYFSFQYGKWGGTVKNHLVYCLTIAPDLIAARRGACVWMRSPSLVQMVVSVKGDDARLEGLGIVAAFKVIRLPGGIVKNL